MKLFVKNQFNNKQSWLVPKTRCLLKLFKQVKYSLVFLLPDKNKKIKVLEQLINKLHYLLQNRIINSYKMIKFYKIIKSNKKNIVQK